MIVVLQNPENNYVETNRGSHGSRGRRPLLRKEKRLVVVGAVGFRRLG